MKNFIQNGKFLTYTIPSATTIVPGQVLIINGLKGIAQTGGTAGDKISVALTGVFELPKATGAINQGAIVYWNPTGNPVVGATGSGAITTTESTNVLMGHCFEGVASGDAFVLVRLDN
jgi:predicted RecA/RadA family phage recombinase